MAVPGHPALLVISPTASFSSSRLIMSSVMFPVQPISSAMETSLARAAWLRIFRRARKAWQQRKI